MRSCRASVICCFPGKNSHRLAVGVSAGCPALKTDWRGGGATVVVITGHAPRTGPRRAIVNCATSKISSGGWLCKCSRSSDNKQRNPPTAGGQTVAKKHDAAPFTIQRSTEYQWTVIALSYSYLDSLASWFKPVLDQHNSMLSSVCLC